MSLALLGSALMGMAVLWGQGGSRRDLCWVVVGLSPGSIRHPGETAVLSLMLVAGAMFKRGHSSLPEKAQRQALVRFWQEVGLYLTAGLTFWQSVDGANRDVSSMKEGVQELARAVAAEGNPTASIQRFMGRYPGPEGEIIAAMLWHGYHHGVRVEDVQRQAVEMDEQLAFEEEVHRQADPLWLTVLPAILLLNLLWILGEPFLATLMHGFPGF